MNLNDSTPAAPTGRKNVKWQCDHLLRPANVSAYVDDGGVNGQTGTSYTIVEGDNRKLVYLNNASAVAVAVDPSANLGSAFFCWLENLGAGTVTLTPNATETIDGAASLTLGQNEGIMLFSDGSNLFTSRGKGGSGSFTASGDLSGTSSSQTVVGLQGKALDTATVGSPSDGDVIKYDSASGKYKAAAESGGGFMTLISSQTLASDAASVTFSSISGTYKRLAVFFKARQVRTGTKAEFMCAQFNGDTGLNYEYFNKDSRPGLDNGYVNSALDRAFLAMITAAGADANAWATGKIEIERYAAADNLKLAIIQAGRFETIGTNSTYWISQGRALWNSTAAITSVLLLTRYGDNLLAGSSFDLYGIS